MTAPPETDAGFVAFYRRYTRTWLHALATAGLTAFGTLTFFHRGFAALAIGAYVLPPVALYVIRRTPAEDRTAGAASEENGTANAGARGTTDPETDHAADTSGRWSTVASPTDATLFDVAVTDAGAYAVGADGIVLADDGDGWRTVLVEGPSAAAETLRGTDATADGEGVWIAGDGGAVARLDAATGRHVDFTPPAGRTDTWEDVAVAGSDGDERVLLINGSGELLRGRYRGRELSWDEPVKPGGGSSLSGVAFADDDVGYACDTNDGVFETTDGGETFRRIGVAVDGTLTDVATAAPGDCVVSADDGVLHRRDRETWTPIRLGDEALNAVAFRGERGVACGDCSVYERADAEADWERAATFEDGSLAGVSLGSERAVAVGSDGAIVERA